MPTGKQIKKLTERRCAELGINVSDVSRKAGRAQSWIYSIFDSDNVQAKTIHRLAQALNVEPAYFFTLDNLNNSDENGGEK